MSSTVFFEGAAELATVSNTFTVDGVATDPTAVTLTITDPTGVDTVYTGAQVTHVATGIYKKDIPCTIVGTWAYQWTGTIVGSDVVAGTWEVHETQLGHLYCTVEMLKSRFKDTRTADDLEYHSACFAASRALEQYCGRVFYRSTDTRTFLASDSTCLRLPDFCDLVSVDTLTVGGLASGGYTLVTDDGTPNINAGPEPKPYVAILGTFPAAVEITGVWGWPSVPWAIKAAAALVAAETFKLKDSAGMVASGYDDFDVTMLAAEGRRRFARFANPYRRHAFLVA